MQTENFGRGHIRPINRYTEVAPEEINRIKAEVVNTGLDEAVASIPQEDLLAIAEENASLLPEIPEELVGALEHLSDEDVKDFVQKSMDEAINKCLGLSETEDSDETEYAEPTAIVDDGNEGRKEMMSHVLSGDYDGDVPPPEGYDESKHCVEDTSSPKNYNIGPIYLDADPRPLREQLDDLIAKYPDTTDEAQGLFRIVIDKLTEQNVSITINDAEETLKTLKTLMTHCRIELLKDQLDLKRVEDMSEIAIAMKEQSKSFDETADAIEKLATGDIFGPATPDENGEVNEGEHTLGNLARMSTEDAEIEDEEDIETLCDNMLKDIAIAKATFNVVFDWYNSSHKTTTIYDDILEKLEKDMVTIEASSDLNAGRKLKAIREVIDSIESRDSSFLLDSLYAKTENPKRLRAIGKDSIKYGSKLYNNLTKLGFTREDIANFMNFFVTENQFRSIYNTGEQYINFGEIFKKYPKEELPNYVAREMCAICFFFLYHLSKICESEKKREYYLTIKYRLGIILVCDTNLKNPSKPSTFRSRFEEPITEEPITETELSLTRSKLYDMYMPLLARYYDIMKDASLMKYSESVARKKN